MDTHLLCLRPVDQCTCHGDPHTAEAHRVISAELVACTLGQRQRPELRVDVAGRIAAGIARAVRGMNDALRRAGFTPA